MQLRERAVADLNKIDATIARLEDQLRRAREDRVKLQHFLEVADRYSREQDGDQDRPTPGGRRPSKAARLRELAHGLLSDAGTPVPIGEIAQYVSEQGEEIPGADKGSYLSSVLARDERFENIRNAGWLLANAAWATRGMGPDPDTGPLRQEPEHAPESDEDEPVGTLGQPEEEPDFDPEPEWRPTRQDPAPTRPPASAPPRAAYPRVVRPSIADELDDDIPF